MSDDSKKTVLDSVVVRDASVDLSPLTRSDARVFMLYATHEEAKEILKTVI